MAPEEEFEDFNFLLDGEYSNAAPARGAPTVSGAATTADANSYLNFEVPTSPGQDASLEY